MSDELFPAIWRRRMGALILLVGTAVGVYLLRGILMPFLLAWIAAYLACPVVDRLEKFKVRRERAVVVVFGAMLTLALIVILFTVPLVINEAHKLGKDFPAYYDRLVGEFQRWKDQGNLPPQVEHMLLTTIAKIRDSAPEIASYLVKVVFAWFDSFFAILNLLFAVITFLFVSYYFLVDFHEINRRMIAAVPARYREGMAGLMAEVDANLRTVLRGQLMVAAALSVLYAAGLSFVGVPYALLIGMVSGFGNFLPYIGPFLGLMPAFLFVLLEYGLNVDAAMRPIGGIVVVFVVVQFLEGFVLTPKLAGKSVGLGPVAVLFALSAGGVLFGIFGVVAALPIAAVVTVLLKRGWRMYTASEFFRLGEG